jgi:signal transduction histidine kinase
MRPINGMRATLARGALAVTSMIAIAFLVPLGLLAQQIAHDRALSVARQQASAMVAALAVTQERAVLTRAVASTTTGADGRLILHLPGERPIGTSHARSADLALVAQKGQALTANAAGGIAYLQPIAIAGGRTAVVEVFVPSAELRRGVGQAWVALSALAAVLVAGSTVLADRLGRRVVAAARALSGAARRFGAHDLSARVEPAGPAELAEAGAAFNAMADRIVSLVDADRHRAADLSQRLHTSLTALRLDADALPASEAAGPLRESIDALKAEVDALIVSARDPAGLDGREAVDLVEVLGDRLAFWAGVAEDQHREWDFVGADRPVWIAVPRADAVAAVDSLLGNIVRHTPAGTPMRVTIGDDVLVVEDGGRGMSDWKAAVRRGVSGGRSTGPGLDIARRVAAEAGGEVHIGRSRDLGGARIAMTFEPADPGTLAVNRFRRGRPAVADA